MTSVAESQIVIYLLKAADLKKKLLVQKCYRLHEILVIGFKFFLKSFAA